MYLHCKRAARSLAACIRQPLCKIKGPVLWWWRMPLSECWNSQKSPWNAMHPVRWVWWGAQWITGRGLSTGWNVQAALVWKGRGNNMGIRKTAQSLQDGFVPLHCYCLEIVRLPKWGAQLCVLSPISVLSKLIWSPSAIAGGFRSPTCPQLYLPVVCILRHPQAFM